MTTNLEDFSQSASNATGEAAPSEQEIATRANELYLERGAEEGHELDDWLRAERELKTRKSAAATA